MNIHPHTSLGLPLFVLSPKTPDTQQVKLTMYLTAHVIIKGTDHLNEIWRSGSHVTGGGGGEVPNNGVDLLHITPFWTFPCELWSHCAVVWIAHIQLWEHSVTRHALIHMVCRVSGCQTQIYALVFYGDTHWLIGLDKTHCQAGVRLLCGRTHTYM